MKIAPAPYARYLGLTIGACLLAAAALSGPAQSKPDAPAAPAPAGTPAKPGTKEFKARHVDAAGAEKLLKQEPKTVVLDVRTAGEFSGSHIAGAKNIDFNAPTFAADVEKLDRSKTYVVHCAADGRSTRSLEVFKKLGFSSVVHLDGGFNAWTKAGKPVEKSVAPTAP